MKGELICYCRKCPNKVEYKWYPNKNKGHLHVCKQHYEELTMVFFVEDLGKEGELTAVRVVPEPE